MFKVPPVTTKRRVAWWPSSATVNPPFSIVTVSVGPIVIADVMTTSGQFCPKTTVPPAETAAESAASVHVDTVVPVAERCGVTVAMCEVAPSLGECTGSGRKANTTTATAIVTIPARASVPTDSPMQNIPALMGTSSRY
jgi:hypothetical protein